MHDTQLSINGHPKPPQRIEVKGWGSSQLYHPGSPECRYNIRVEIERLAQEE